LKENFKVSCKRKIAQTLFTKAERKVAHTIEASAENLEPNQTT
jgi:hypothetical protein